MRVNISGQSLRIMFAYGYKIAQIHGKPTSRPVLVECSLKDDKGTVCSRVGIATCADGDNFCRETGRKLALKRAISAYSRDLRTRVWTAYFDRKQLQLSTGLRQAIAMVASAIKEDGAECNKKGSI